MIGKLWMFCNCNCICELLSFEVCEWFGHLAVTVFFRCNADCAREITALAISAVPSLMTNLSSLPTGLLNTLLTTLLETTKVYVHATCL